ncbi:MAG: PPC domain-containing protein [Phycisphaerales bacterium]|nr:PPC domain-containing protein [Phycisphaerales bacterium]
MNMKVLATTLCVLAATGTANAAFSDMESNDTIGTSNFIGSFGGGDFNEIGSGTITVGDVDWFSFTITNEATIQFDQLASADFNTTASLQLVDSDMSTILASAQGTVSPLGIQALTLDAGTYYVGVTGGVSDYASVVFDGSMGAAHNDSFGYKLVIGASVVPVPMAAWAGLGLLVPMGIKRRMNRRG